MRDTAFGVAAVTLLLISRVTSGSSLTLSEAQSSIGQVGLTGLLAESAQVLK